MKRASWMIAEFEIYESWKLYISADYGEMKGVLAGTNRNPEWDEKRRREGAAISRAE